MRISLFCKYLTIVFFFCGLTVVFFPWYTLFYQLVFINICLNFQGDHYFTSKSGKDRRNSKKKTAAPRAPQFTPMPSSQPPLNNSNFGKGGVSSPTYSHNSPTSFYQPPHPSTNFVSQQYNSSDNVNFRLDKWFSLAN